MVFHCWLNYKLILLNHNLLKMKRLAISKKGIIKISSTELDLTLKIKSSKPLHLQKNPI